jgi:uncharacterized protein with NRDE domain
MCLLVFAFRSHPEYPLIFAGNRDEFHGRPTRGADIWDDHPELLAGKDLQAGGTWLGVTKAGRFATVTNFREPDIRGSRERSRGEIVVDYLTSPVSPPEFLTNLEADAQQYSGFNLLLGSADTFHYLSNRNGPNTALSPDIYGLSNGMLDTPWPKVQRAKRLFEEVVERSAFTPEDLLDVLADRHLPVDEELPSTGFGLEWERVLSSIFISGPEYGTRASTVVLMHRSGEIVFVERSFAPGGGETDTRRFRFQTETS